MSDSHLNAVPASQPRCARSGFLRRWAGGLGCALVWLLKSPFLLLSWFIDAIISQRGLALLGLLICALLAIGPWLRPPISLDIRGPHLPLGIDPERTLSIDQIVSQKRPIVLDSVALPLLAVILLAVVPVLISPRAIWWFAGVLTAFAIAATAATILNHPALVEQLEFERQERLRIRLIMQDESEQLLSVLLPPRVDDPQYDSGVIPAVGVAPNDPLRGWMYVVYGPWLIGFAAFVVICSGSGSIGRRLSYTGLWCLLGVALSVVVTHRRLQAEYQFQMATVDEAENQYGSALARLEESRGCIPHCSRRPASVSPKDDFISVPKSSRPMRCTFSRGVTTTRETWIKPRPARDN